MSKVSLTEGGFGPRTNASGVSRADCEPAPLREPCPSDPLAITIEVSSGGDFVAVSEGSARQRRRFVERGERRRKNLFRA